MESQSTLESIQSQIRKLSSSLEEVQKVNQQIVHRLSQQSENGKKSEAFIRKATEMHESLKSLEKRDGERGKTLALLEEKVSLLFDKVEKVCEMVETRNKGTAHKPDKQTGDDQIRIRIKRLNNVQGDVRKDPVQSKPDNTRNDSGNIEERKPSVVIKAAALKPNLTERLMEEEMKEIKRPLLKTNELGLRLKETDMSVDNRVKVISGSTCVPGKIMEGATKRYRTPLTEDTPEKNNLPTRKEVLAMRKLGPKQSKQSRPRRPVNRNEFKNLAGLIRDPDEVPDIRDMNSWRSMAEAERQKGLTSDAPKNDKCLDTCLLLDISASMEGDSFDEMIKMAKHYVKGIDEISKVLNLEENIGIATFGHYTGVVQHMTSDYQKIQDTLDMLTPGGSSPMSAGLYMGLACCLGNREIVKSTVLSKIILFTDGKATSDLVVQAVDDDPPSSTTEKLMIHMALTETSKDIGKRNIRIYCYPIGCESETHLKVITESTEGKIYKGDGIHKLIRMSQNTGFALSMKDNLPDAEGLDLSIMKDLWRSIGISEENDDFDDIADLAKFFKDRAGESSSSDRYSESDDPDLPPLGTRVRRGPDWDWDNQDSNGPGTLVGHTKGQVWVEWDSGHLNVYKYHALLGYDVLPVEEPRVLKNELIAVGCLVQRGNDWRYKDQDGGPGNVGVVIKVEKDGTVVVRWPNKSKAIYKYGRDGFFEVKICDPSTVFGRPGSLKTHVWGTGSQLGDGTDSTEKEGETASGKGNDSDGVIVAGGSNGQTISRGDSEEASATGLSVEDMNKRNARKAPPSPTVTWLYEKDDDWLVYPDDVTERIERAFKRKSQHCIVEVDGNIFQISFSKMKQVCNKTGMISSVKRVEKGDDDPQTNEDATTE